MHKKWRNFFCRKSLLVARWSGSILNLLELLPMYGHPCHLSQRKIRRWRAVGFDRTGGASESNCPSTSKSSSNFCRKFSRQRWRCCQHFRLVHVHVHPVGSACKNSTPCVPIPASIRTVIARLCAEAPIRTAWLSVGVVGLHRLHDNVLFDLEKFTWKKSTS